MTYTFDVKIGNRTLRLSNTVQGPKQVFEELCFWQELPAVCACGSADLALNFAVRGKDKHSFYALKCCKCKMELKMGQSLDKVTLFPKDGWRYYQKGQAPQPQKQPGLEEPNF